MRFIVQAKLPACRARMVSSLYHALLAFGWLFFWSDFICLFRAGHGICLFFTGCSESVYFLSEYILHVLSFRHFLFCCFYLHFHARATPDIHLLSVPRASHLSLPSTFPSLPVVSASFQALLNALCLQPWPLWLHNPSIT